MTVVYPFSANVMVEAAAVADIAKSEEVTPAYAGSVLKLAYLAPAVLDTLLIQRVPPVVSVRDLALAAELPRTEQALEVFGTMG